MSAYMVNDNTINTVVTFIFKNPQAWAIRAMLHKRGYTSPKRLGLRMFVFNMWGVNARYGENSAQDFRPLDYCFKSSETIPTAKEALDCIGEWSYQCAEGHNPDKAFYKLMITAEKMMHDIAKNEAYQQAINKPQARRIDIVDVAKLVRAKLKATYPTVKFSVKSERYAGGSSIDVSWVDGPTTKETEALIGMYHGATFDGMIDLKSHHDTTDPDTGELVHYGNDYIFCHRSYSKDALESIWQSTCEKYGVSPDKATLKNEHDHWYYKFEYDRNRGYREDYQSLFNITASDTSFCAAQPPQDTPDSVGVTYGEYKGHATITLPYGDKGFTFGVSKAESILAHLDAIKAFVEQHT